MPFKDKEGNSADTLSTLAYVSVTSSDGGESGAVDGEARSSGEFRGLEAVSAWPVCSSRSGDPADYE